MGRRSRRLLEAAEQEGASLSPRVPPEYGLTSSSRAPRTTGRRTKPRRARARRAKRKTRTRQPRTSGRGQVPSSDLFRRCSTDRDTNDAPSQQEGIKRSEEKKKAAKEAKSKEKEKEATQDDDAGGWGALFSSVPLCPPTLPASKLTRARSAFAVDRIVGVERPCQVSHSALRLCTVIRPYLTRDCNQNCRPALACSLAVGTLTCDTLLCISLVVHERTDKREASDEYNE